MAFRRVGVRCQPFLFLTGSPDSAYFLSQMGIETIKAQFSPVQFKLPEY